MKKKNYTKIARVAKSFGIIPYENRYGKTEEGVYSLNRLHAPIDLSEIDENNPTLIEILQTAVVQLSETVNESYHQAIERNFND